MTSKEYYANIAAQMTLDDFQTVLKLRRDESRPINPLLFALDRVTSAYYYTFTWSAASSDLNAELKSFERLDQYLVNANGLFSIAHRAYEHHEKLLQSSEGAQENLAEKLAEYRGTLAFLSHVTDSLTPLHEKLNNHATRLHNLLYKSIDLFRDKAVNEVEQLIESVYRYRDAYYLTGDIEVARSYLEMMSNWYEYAQDHDEMFDFNRLESTLELFTELEVSLLLHD